MANRVRCIHTSVITDSSRTARAIVIRTVLEDACGCVFLCFAVRVCAWMVRVYLECWSCLYTSRPFVVRFKS